ncbi:MAG: MFS transporter [Erythrobacter sp.]|nr:MFS transporter [Erythrobacter sp.]NNC48209.1 MFS transporter [Sphingomonas sp.]RZV52819.1 MAG: MFS transporter [Sphingomonadaceae bacterium]
MTGRFGPLYVTANFGAHVAFMPLLVLLLPRRVEAIAPDQPIVLLSQLLLVGGLTASISNIAFGAFSDRWLARFGNRRGPIAVGLLCLIGAYAYFARADAPGALFLATILFQLSLNIMFAPLGALLADHIPDARKGWIAGWLNMGLPLSGLVITVLGEFSASDAAWPFGLVAMIVAATVIPLIIAWPRDLKLLAKPVEAVVDAVLSRRDFAFAWIARLCIQSGAAVILSYLYLYVNAVARNADGFSVENASGGVALLSLLATIFSLAAGILAGRWSDRKGSRKRPLIYSALLAAGAFGLLSWGGDWRVILAAYALFTIALTAFLSVDSALVAQLVAGHPRRATFLGLMNLTNTLPAIIAPGLALFLASVQPGGDTLRFLLAVAAGGALTAAFAVSAIRTIR